MIAVPENIPNVTVDGKALWTTMMNETDNIDLKVLHAINKLKGKKK